MTWAAELAKTRRLLRDPNGLIWSDAFLRHTWNDVQRDFQNRTLALEDVVAQRVPAVYQCAYMHDWEWRFLPHELSKFYQCLTQFDDGVICHRWEPQALSHIAADVADVGIHFTQPWEGCLSEMPGDLVKMFFPLNFGTMKFIAYDEVPIEAMTQKDVQSVDPSYLTRTGIPVGYFPCDQTDDAYALYPRPSVSFVNELSGEALAFYAAGDDEDDTTGTIAVRSGSSDLESGVALDIVDTSDSVFMVYSVQPTELALGSDEPDTPVFLNKYLRYGVIGRAYSANTEGRIKSLGEFWTQRYELGITFTKRWLRLRRQDRDYRLTTPGAPARRSYRHPRLPDAYPAVDP